MENKVKTTLDPQNASLIDIRANQEINEKLLVQLTKREKFFYGLPFLLLLIGIDIGCWIGAIVMIVLVGVMGAKANNDYSVDVNSPVFLYAIFFIIFLLFGFLSIDWLIKKYRSNKYFYLSKIKSLNQKGFMETLMADEAKARSLKINDKAFFECIDNSMITKLVDFQAIFKEEYLESIKEEGIPFVTTVNHQPLLITSTKLLNFKLHLKRSSCYKEYYHRQIITLEMPIYESSKLNFSLSTIDHNFLKGAPVPMDHFNDSDLYGFSNDLEAFNKYLSNDQIKAFENIKQKHQSIKAWTLVKTYTRLYLTIVVPYGSWGYYSSTNQANYLKQYQEAFKGVLSEQSNSFGVVVDFAHELASINAPKATELVNDILCGTFMPDQLLFELLTPYKLKKAKALKKYRLVEQFKKQISTEIKEY